MASRSYFTQKELKEFRRLLEEKRALLVESLESFVTSSKTIDRSAFKGDEGDNASREVEGALRLRLQDKNRKLLLEINNALEKFDDGTYGICEGTEEYISKPRLRLRPWSRYSIEHKEFLDQQKRLHH